mmetsp:Transcript_31807/g.66856  ORF Transcript_31807/g.66856 Transcript_31807/m.66856 type:complete len:798 (-) Transcript_31807:884-3277(-)|eukprot:CAMPEP_0172316038 /NCGR_PEP_ID=MMETSP1058-20130122/27040_1 /TAXON_ID=83371 /ORGANISM="Detonula confervacea, Strain CCMP 353" /LENGTH=797 /DNA_ID=CAMNT_0013030257 /DNA_START=12 /DNA_END=2405 /DNA_ORIENTATION=+
MISTMRFPHCLARASSRIRGSANLSRAVYRDNGAASHLAVGQSRDASTTSALPPRHDRNFRVGGFANKYDAGDLGFNNHLHISRNGDGWWMNRATRAFSSTESVGDDAGVGALNQQIISLAESGDITKSEEMLNQMRAEAVSQNQKDGLPDVDSYTALMNAFIEEQMRLISVIEVETNEIKSDVNATMPNEHCAESNEQGAVTVMTLAEKAHDLLIQMEDLSGVSDHYSSMRLSGGMETELRNASLQPTSHHYDSVILALANATTAAHETHCTLTKNAPFIAQRWLQRMETLAFDPQSGVTPTVDSYFHVMEAYVASEKTILPNKQSKTPITLQSVFDKLKLNTNIRPTAREYRLLLRTWCDNSGIKQAAYNAMGLWMTMQKSFKGGVEEMEPTLEDGKMVLEAWTRSINKHSARRAQKVLSTMENLYADKQTDVQPDLDCYRYVLITMSRSRVPTVGDEVPQLFKSMEDNHIFPDTPCFDAAIETLKNCARHSKAEDSNKYAKATESMLQKMESERERSSVAVIKPSAVTYTNVIQALAVRESKMAAEKADELLKKMIAEYGAGDESMRPTRHSYVGTIHAYGNSGAESNFLNANEVLQRMIADYSQGNEEARPDASSFHAVIRACARSSDTSSSPEKHKQALLLAISTVQHMKKSDSYHANSRSYLLLLKCCTSLLPSGSEREKALRSIFRSCCKDGLVNEQVLNEFQSVVSSEIYHKEVVKDAPSYNGIKSLPETWTRSLGYRVRTHETKDGIRKRNPIISVRGEAVASTAYNDHRMRRRWSKKNQKVLQGGRI